jgi:hypothetical protein
VLEQPYISALNRATKISKATSAGKVKWVAVNCSKDLSNRLKGKAGTKRPILMTSVKSLAARFY